MFRGQMVCGHFQKCGQLGKTQRAGMSTFFCWVRLFRVKWIRFCCDRMKDQENYSNFQTVCYKRFKNRMQTTTE